MNDSKPAQKRTMPKPGTYKPKTVQARVIPARLAGKSKRQIAMTEKINRRTVVHILSQAEYQDIQDSYRQEVQRLVPDCIEGLKNKLRTKTGKARKRGVDWRMLVEILKGTQILITREVQEQERTIDRYHNWSDDDLDRFLATGEKPTITIHLEQTFPAGKDGAGSGSGRETEPGT
jgi:hypothetical protein